MSKPSWIGITLNERYRIEEMIGQGGMSAVYKATDPNLKRVVAIKLIHGHLADNQQFIYRFEEEAAAVAKLRHPNIVQVFDFNHDGETYYMVLEFVAGESLNQRVRRMAASGRQIPLSEAIQAIAQVCDAVDYAHKRGLVHRDIKPANIMIDVHGQAILMDFGIVKIVGGEKHTATGAVVGTAHYMSPEQVKGEHADHRSDIYSLGVTLFEILSGKPPFTADSVMTIMMMHLTDPVPDIGALRKDVPVGLKAVIEKAMAKEPAARYQSAAEMAADLRAVLSPGGLRSSAPSPNVPIANFTPGLTESSTAFKAPSSEVHKAQSSTAVESRFHTLTPPPPTNGYGMTPPPLPAADSGATLNTPFSATTGSGSGSAAPFSASNVTLPQPKPTSPSYTPQAPPQQQPSLRNSSTIRKPLLIGGGLGLLAIIALIVAIIAFGGKDGTGENTAMLAQAGTQTAAAFAALLPPTTETPTQTSEATATPTSAPPTPTKTVEPTITHTPWPSATPTVTVPPGILYVRINNITIDAQNRYVVEYETFEYTEQLPGIHIHFFFDNVLPENAGMPGNGPWILYGGPRPFTGYKVSDKPASATQMCALVANANHSVQANSGTCFQLP